MALEGHRPLVTQVLIAASLAVFVWDLLQGANPMTGSGGEASRALGLWAPLLEFEGEWYRVVTSAFTHRGLIHIGFNMWLLWMLGRPLEARFGPLTFATIYATGIVGGSLGALLVEPAALVVGASGAVFALMGVMLMLQRSVGINVFQSGIGGLVLINVLLSFRSGISLGGHLGGLAVGLAMGWVLAQARQRGPRGMAVATVAIASLGLLVALAIIPAVDRAVGL